jgi:HEAT repeat protein
MTPILSSQGLLACFLCLSFTVIDLGQDTVEATPDKLSVYQQEYQNPDPEVRRRAVALLGNLGAEAIPTLIEALRDENRAVRQGAERALHKIGPASLPALDRMLEDAHFETPQTAAHTIVWMGPAAAPTILKVLEEYRPDAWNRLYEVSNISNLPNETKAAIVPGLVRLLEHRDSETRLRAMQYMGYMKPTSEQALPQIMQALKGEDTMLRGKAARVLYGIGKPAGPFLVTALQDSNQDVRELIVDMLTSPAFSRDDALRGLEQTCRGDSSPAVRQKAQSALHNGFRKPRQSVC